MKRNKAAKRWLRRRKRAVKGGVSKLTHFVAQAEEQVPGENGSVRTIEPAQNQNLNIAGILRPDDAKFRLPSALAEAGEDKSEGWMPGGFVLFVTGLAILFITIIAWLVSEMPAAK